MKQIERNCRNNTVAYMQNNKIMDEELHKLNNTYE